MTPTNYCHVLDGTVTRGPEPLPKEWEADGKTILGFDKVTNPEAFGWYPVERLSIPEGHYLDSPSYSLVGNRVVESGSVLPIPPYVPPVPSEISARQARIVLELNGLLDDVNAAVAASPRVMQLTWEYATSVSRKDPMLAQMAASMGISEAQMDEMFRLGATL